MPFFHVDILHIVTSTRAMNSANPLTGVVSSPAWIQGVNILTSASNVLLKQLENMTSDKKRLTLITTAVVAGSYVLWKTMIPTRRRSETLQIDMVSGGLPYFGHYFELLHDHQAFLKRCKKEKGPAFKIRINNEDLTIVTGPLIRYIFSCFCFECVNCSLILDSDLSIKIKIIIREMLHKSRYFNFDEGIQSIIPINRAIQVSYDHKFKGEKLRRREKNPSKEGIHMLNSSIGDINVVKFWSNDFPSYYVYSCLPN